MKKAILILTSSLFSILLVAQTTSTNFEVTNCDGELYNLFDDLDQGNVVVIVWVMPCVSCIQHPLEAYQIVQDYDPQKVKYLMVDDYADHNCSDIQTWSEDYQMGSSTKIVDNAITMDDYGVHGMPKIVVTGCKSHKVFFNKNSSTDGIKAAIDAAIAECSATTIDESKYVSTELEVFPNPANEVVNFTVENQRSLASTLSITNLLGEEVVIMDNYFTGQPIYVSFLPNGIYLTKIISYSKIYSRAFVVNR